MLELEGFFAKTPVVKYILPYSEYLEMVESPNLTDPYIFKVRIGPHNHGSTHTCITLLCSMHNAAMLAV